MNLDLDEEQESLRRSFAELFSRESPSHVVRDAEPGGFSPALWELLAATGVPAMALPEEAGGAGARLSDCVVVAEQAGRLLAPVPLAEHVAAGRAVARGAAPEFTARIAAAGTPVTLVPRPVRAGRALVPAGAVARHVVVLDEARGRLLVVEGEPPGDAVPNLACLPLAERDLDLDGPAVTVVATGAEAERIFAEACGEWRLLLASMLVGLAEDALRRTVEYVRERHQFGRPIGGFQAIQHGLAEFPGRIAGARLLAARAAWSADEGTPDAARLARAAFAFASDTARQVTSRAIHYHGGYGVMAEHDIQLHYRRAKGWPLQAGDPAEEYRRLADIMYGPSKGV